MPRGQAEKSEDTIQQIVRNPNYVRDLIYISLALAEYTKIPFLFLGNPGIAKTTGVRLWAKNYGYKVTTLIGTQRVAEEILGYMVNDVGEKKLITYTPDWFNEIIENKEAGFKTLLFVDELSQAPDNVQGAMLQLIFDRRVGGKNNYLPDDCLVVSAANYKGNIPPQCGIQAPTLNRFEIINVQPQDGIGLIMEFTQDEDEMVKDIPVMNNIPISDAIKQTIKETTRDSLSFLAETFSKDEGGQKCLDFSNTNFADIFDQTGPIYGFLTGRTIHYLRRMAEGCVHLEVARKSQNFIIEQLALGLGGLGTNTFSTDKQRHDYEEAFVTAFKKILRNAFQSNMNEINSIEIDYTGKTIEKNISNWMRSAESNGRLNDVNLNRLVKLIKNTYGTTAEAMEDVLNNYDQTRFLGDIQKIETMNNYLKTSGILEIQPFVRVLEIILATYEGYKSAILTEMVK